MKLPEMERTNGRWEVQRIDAYGQRDRLAVVAVAADLVLVTHTFDGNEAHANMCLMAAAPDLLDALERLIHMAECNTTPGPNTLAQARAAIDKAFNRH